MDQIIYNNKNNENNENNEDRKIKLFQIIKHSILENKKIILSFVLLLVAFWLQDVYFSNKLGTFTSDIDKFIKELSVSNVLVLFLPTLFAEFLFYVSNVLLAKSSPQIKTAVMHKLVDDVIESAKTSKTPINSNELILNIKKTNEIETIYDLLASYIVPTILVGLGIIFTFYKTSKKYCIIALIIFLIFFIVLFLIHTQSVNMSFKVEADTSNYFDTIHDTASNIDTVITSTNKQKELDKLEINKKNVVNSQYDGDIAASNVLIQANIVSIMFIVIMVGLSLYLYTIKKLTTPEVTSICIMLVLFFKYCDSALYKIKLNTQSIGKMYELNNYFNDFTIKKQNSNMFVIKDNENAEIRFIDVSLTYKNKVVFNKLNIIFPGSKKTILLGPNGVGKSTILKLIAGLLEYSGTIAIDGKDTKKYNYDSMMKHIGYIQQQPKLFNRTIYENLNYGSNYTKEQINGFVIKFGLKSFFDKFPNKLDTIAGVDGNQLSGGQRQIITVLRTLVQNKKIILLDEPTSAVDDFIKNTFVNLINNIHNKTIIIVTHDKSIIDIADTIVDISLANKI